MIIVIVTENNISSHMSLDTAMSVDIDHDEMTDYYDFNNATHTDYSYDAYSSFINQG